MATTTEAARLYSVPEAATQLGVSRYWIYGRIADGTLPYVDLGAGGKRTKYRIRATDLDALIDSLTYTNHPDGMKKAS